MLEEVIEVFEKLKSAYEQCSTYEEKLDFWYKYDLKGTTLYISFLDKELDYWYDSIISLKNLGGRHKNVVYLNSTNQILLFEEFISIIPQNNKETNSFIQKGEEILKKENLHLDAQYSIDNYWKTIESTVLAEEFLNKEYDKVINIIEKYENKHKVYKQLFNIGYNSVLLSKEIDYQEVYDTLYRSESQNSEKERYSLPEAITIHIKEGIKYANYKAFLNVQYKRLQKEENIQLKESPVTTVIQEKKKEDEKRVKLIWNGEMDVLYDLFIQLLNTRNSDNSKMLVGNSIASLAEFIAENVESAKAMPDSIASRITVIKNDEAKRPKRYRIDLQVDRSK